MTYSQPPHYSFGDSGDNQPQQPSSGPPGYSPHPPEAYPGQPVAPTTGMPAGMPTTGVPMAPTPPQKSSSPLLPVLAIASALCFVGAVLFGILWFQEKGEREDADARASEAEALAEDRSEEIETLEADLSAAQEDVEFLEGELLDLESQISDVDTMQECVDALDAFYDTEPGSDEEEEALLTLSVACAEWVY
jgi:uncharacterized protein HemX